MQTIIFDVDGVIFKAMDEEGCYLWRKNIEADLGITREHISKIYNADWNNVTRGKRDIKAHLQYLFDTCPELNLTAEEYLAYWQKNDIHIDPDVLTLIKTIQSPMYLGTNQDPLRTKHIEKMVGKHFKGIFSSCNIGYIKPEVGFYTHIENTLQLLPNQITLIDDSIENVDSAIKRGWNAFFYTNNTQDLQTYLKASGVDLSINNCL